MKKSILFFCFLFLWALMANGQCLLEKINLSDKTRAATYIFEGKVTTQHSFWNKEKSLIYTAHNIELHKNLKASLPKIITLITLGGQVGETIAVIEPSLKLMVGDYGLFFADDSAITIDNLSSEKATETLLQTYGGQQGFIRYDLYTQIAHSHFSNYSNIPTQLYEPITKQLKRKIKVIKDTPFDKNSIKNNGNKSFIAPIVGTIVPQTVVAGTGQVLTVTGTDFGTFSGPAKIQFYNPNYFAPTISYQSVANDHILSWTDTQIQLIVPARDVQSGKAGAGTGKIRIVNDAGELVESSQTVTVLFNKISLNLREIDLINQNGSGGYTFRYSNNFNSTAQTTFERALSTWQCKVQSPFTISSNSTSATCPANDNINLVAFDNNCSLPTGILAQTTHWYAACGNGDAFFMELDVVFSRPNNTNWNFGPSATTGSNKDFESICIHELGHTHGAEHTLNIGETMYPALNNATDVRYIDNNTANCVNLVIEHSSQNNNCGGTTAINPPASCGVKLQGKVLLEGSYSGNGQMTTMLNSNLPLTQPFSTIPWAYTGTEGLSIFPNNIVDWVLVELMDNNFDVVEQRAALLRSDGVLVDVNNNVGVDFQTVSSGSSYYIALRHRNHLAILSKNKVTLPNTTAYNFTDPNKVMGGTQQLSNVGGEVYALYAGDFNADGIISVADFNIYENSVASGNTYNKSDSNLDNAVTVADFNYYQPNASKLGVKAIRY